MADQDLQLIVCVLSVGQQLYYPACQRCLVRLRTQNNRLLCPRCKTTYCDQQINYRYRLKLNVTDQHSIADITLFGQCVENVFGATAIQLHEMISTRQSRYNTSLAKIWQHIINFYFVGSMFKLSFSSKRYSSRAKQACQYLSEIKIKPTSTLNFYSGYYPSFIATKIEHASARKETVIKQLEHTLSQIRCSCTQMGSDNDNVLTAGNIDVSTSVSLNDNDWQAFLWDSEEWNFDEIETNNLQCQGLSHNDELKLFNDDSSTSTKGSKTCKLTDHQMDINNDGEYSYNRTWISPSPPSLNLTCCTCGDNMTMTSNLEQSWSSNNLPFNISAYYNNLSQVIDLNTSISSKVKGDTCTTEATQDCKVASRDAELESSIIEQAVTLSSSNESLKLTHHPVTSSSPKQSYDESFPSETLLLYSRSNSDDKTIRNRISFGESNCSQNHAITYGTETAETLMLFSPINTSGMVEQCDRRKSHKRRRRLSAIPCSYTRVSEKENVEVGTSPSNCNADSNKNLSIMVRPNEGFNRHRSDDKTMLLFSPGNSSTNSQLTQSNTKIANKGLEVNQQYSSNDQIENRVNKTLKRKLFSKINV